MTIANTTGQRSRGVALALGFLAGAVAVLTFHQGAIALLTATGRNEYRVPLIAPRDRRSAGYWLAGIALGALALPMVGWFIVAPLKGQPVAAGWNGARMGFSMLINGAWGLGVAVIYGMLQRRPADA